MTGREAKERLQKQYERQNNHIKNNYDRISVTLPKGCKDIIRNNFDSVNRYINDLVLSDLRNKGIL